MALFQQLRTVQSSLGDQRVEVVNIEYPGSRQSADDKSDRLELRSRLGDAVFVYTECLNVEVVRKVLEAAFVRYLRSKKEQPEGNVGRLNRCCEDECQLPYKFENGGNFGLPFRLLQQLNNTIQVLRLEHVLHVRDSCTACIAL